MTEELQLKLVEKYPKILRDFRGDPMHTCMAWGFECDSGWYKLLDECMAKLQYFCDKVSTPDNEVYVNADQIKEKYGTLRFYYHVVGANSIENDIIEDIVNQAERESGHTCELSGERGVPCKKWGWYKTLSYEEARKNEYVACDLETEEYWKTKDQKKNEHNKVCPETQTDQEVGNS